jgi:YidC/Oxa1 family membrane protein insertase
MDILKLLYNEILHKPLLNALIWLTAILPFHDLGFAVIILTVAVRFLLFPFTHHSVKAQIKMRTLEPEIAKIREEHKENQQEQGQKIMTLYKEHGVNPFSGCLMLLVQLPILIALYRVFWLGIDIETLPGELYSFVSLPESINTMFLGAINLMEASIIIAALAGITQFIQMKLAMPPSSAPKKEPTANGMPDISRIMTTQMTYVMPIVIFVIGLRFPAAVSLYWTTMNLFAIIHESIVRRKAQNIIRTSSQNHESERSNTGNKESS